MDVSSDLMRAAQSGDDLVEPRRQRFRLRD